AQQYDEPVIIRMGVKESEELSEGFPDSAEELFAYHGIILDDLETEFFTQDQMLLLRRFVGSRGGGLLMLGGQESFDGQAFGDTPLGELSPVYPPRMTSDKGNGPYLMRLTREGLLQPWVRLRDTELAEQDRVREMPGFLTLNSVGEIKPGATQLAAVENPGDRREFPALVAQRFGKGRTAAWMIGDLWRWSMRRQKDDPDDPGQAWRQMAHWLVNDVPRRAEVRIESNSDPSQPVTMVVNARDEAYLPMDNASVELTIEPLEGESFTMSATMDESEPGTYRATYWSREPGGYRVSAEVTAPDGSFVGRDESGWTAQSGAAEFAELQLNRDLLAKIAEQTGGELIAEDQLDKFAADLNQRDVPVTETWIYPIWHQPWVMFIAVLCLCGEWGLRRWKGLA
ncbi:MAG: glutamine amidotransferase, partial [Planctomycetota bacterium]